MLQTYLKKLDYSWKRFRKSLKRLQDEREYEQKLCELRQLVPLSKSGYNIEGYCPMTGSPRGSTSSRRPKRAGALPHRLYTMMPSLFNLLNTVEAVR